MIGTMRKHQTWLWAVIITITIFTFVVYFQPGRTGDITGGGRGHAGLGTINGRDITPEEFVKARKEVELFFFIRYHEWPGANMPQFNVEHETYSRLLIIEKLKEMKVEVGDEATAQMVTEVFGGQSGKFSMEQYNGFLREIAPHGMSADDFQRLIKHEVGQQHLIALYGLSGKLLAPQEAEMLYRHENETLNVDAVFFSASNYLASVSASETNVQHYFEQNMPQYRVPDKVVVSYIKFDLTNYLAQADERLAKETNLNMIAQSAYQKKGGPQFFKDEKGNGLTFEEALPKIKDEFRKEIAGSDAGKAAADFITDLDKVAGAITNHADKLATLGKVAAEKNLVVNNPPPLDQTMTAKEFSSLHLSPQVLRAASRLTDEEPFTASPVEAEDGFYFVALKSIIPGHNAKLSDIKDKVTHDYKMTEARKEARRACDKFAQAAAKEIAAGKTFAAVCAEEKVKEESLPPFSLSTRALPELKGRVELPNLQNAVSRLAEGKSSDFLGTEDGGAVVYLRSRVEPSAEKIKVELPEFTRTMAEQRQYAAYSQWMSKLPMEMQLAVPESMNKEKK